MNTSLLRSGAEFRIKGMPYAFTGIQFQNDEFILVFRSRWEPQNEVIQLSINQLRDLLTSKEAAVEDPNRQTIEVPCRDGFTICAVTNGDQAAYPGIFVSTRNKWETNLCCVEYRVDPDIHGVHNIYLYEDPTDDEYSRRISITVDETEGEGKGYDLLAATGGKTHNRI